MAARASSTCWSRPSPTSRPGAEPLFSRRARLAHGGEGVMLAPKMLILELGYALLIAAVFVPKPHQMRLLVAAAATAGLGHAFLVRDRVSLIWLALLLAACLVMLGRRFWGNRAARF